MRQVLVIVGVLAAGAGLFYMGYVPRQKQQQAVEASTREVGVLKVRAVRVKPGKQEEALELPGSFDSRKESPIYARAEGYIKSRFVGFGDAVKQGQVLVEIDSPEIERQYQTAKARLSQAEAALKQAEASKLQAIANREIAHTTEQRWKKLVSEGVISRQEGDEKVAQLAAREADVQAAEASINVARESIEAQKAELARLSEIRGFQKVTAPFDGVITARSCEVGNLITPGALAAGRELFKISQVNSLRVLIDVPEVYVPRLKVNQKSELRVQSYPAEVFDGFVSRISNEVDKASRTMTIEVLVEDPGKKLRPGMYTQVRLIGTRREAQLVVPGDALVTRPDGTYIAVVQRDKKVKFRKVRIGRDFGAESEVIEGLQEGELIVVSPSDDVRDGVSVEPSV